MSKTKPKPGQKKPVITAPPVSANLPEGMRAIRVVTLPSMSFKEVGVGVGVLFQDAMRESQVEGKPDKDGVKPKKATIATVTTIPDGEQKILIVPSVVLSNLERDYPGDGYVGKAFYVVNMGKRKEGQRYNDYSITEIAVP